MVTFLVDGLDTKDPEQLEMMLKEQLSSSMNKYQQLKKIDKKDLAEGGRYHRSYISFLSEFKKNIENYVLYLTTEYFLFESTDELADFFKSEDIVLEFKQIVSLAKENNLAWIDFEIEKMRGKLVTYLFSKKVKETVAI